jgi:pentatricopeptide repeat protein
MAAVEIAADVVSFNTVLQVVLDDRSQEVGQAGGGLEREGGRDRNAEGVGEDAEVGYEREEERILEVMQASGVAPDVNTYNARIKAATRRRNHAKVLRLFKQMQATARGVAPATATPEKSAAARARAAAVAGATATAAQHEESRGAGRGSNGSVKANDMTFALVAESCGLVGEVKLVKEMLQRIGPQAPSEALRIGYSALVRAHAVQGLPNKALEVALRARQVGIEVLEGSWYALLDSWAEIGDLEMVQRALGEMEGAGVRLNHIHWSIAIKASCRSGDARACKTALALLRTHIRHPDVVCFNTIISAALKTRDIDSLVIALREMEQCGVEPDHFTRQVRVCVHACGFLWGACVVCVCMFESPLHSLHAYTTHANPGA